MTQMNDARIPEVVHAIKPGGTGCRNDAAAPIKLAFAFQPIVDIAAGRACAHEAHVRGPNGESAGLVLAQVDETNRYHFDQRCRTTAIAQAAALKMEGLLSINFMPNAVYRTEACIRSTLEATEKHGFPIERDGYFARNESPCATGKMN
jgi:EAL domain-containing protein (putative c-di-GMP-specific phosphodiesterase class I)